MSPARTAKLRGLSPRELAAAAREWYDLPLPVHIEVWRTTYPRQWVACAWKRGITKRQRGFIVLGKGNGGTRRQAIESLRYVLRTFSTELRERRAVLLATRKAGE